MVKLSVVLAGIWDLKLASMESKHANLSYYIGSFFHLNPFLP
ncbi:hypothetical protein LV83_01386 [Algoriphagus yeomjeoni]|uniref:Uncharacterized protein n=1 Tax=Algoriphagus yeomjeoni TaxID=291403 RepID=A0A327PKQ9_9BACT|nr:hypothetical protein LV83_01386 [Algoriphagus yeomjeoni]